MYWKTHLISISFVVILFKILSLSFNQLPDDLVLQYMQRDGYSGETHHVTTADGYILVLQRVLSSPYTRRVKVRNYDYAGRNSSVHKRPPVLFMHGLQSSASDYIRAKKNESLPYLLFEKGYDVWLGNYRGAPGSINHTFLEPEIDEKQFWNSSLHEIGIYDLPAMIDYVLNETESKTLFYIGMSLGEATFLVMASSKPEYNDKIQLATVMAPGSHLYNSDNYVPKFLGSIWPVVQVVFDTLGIYEVPLSKIIRNTCGIRITPITYICRWYLYLTIGYANPEAMSIEQARETFETYPARGSAKTVLHYLQLFKSGTFQQFDYSSKKNLEIYGTTEPPKYEMQKITTPIAIFWGENDCWSRPKDVEFLTKSLPNVILSYKVPDKLFNHGDFLSNRQTLRLYEKMIEKIDEYRCT